MAYRREIQYAGLKNRIRSGGVLNYIQYLSVCTNRNTVPLFLFTIVMYYNPSCMNTWPLPIHVLPPGVEAILHRFRLGSGLGLGSGFRFGGSCWVRASGQVLI